MQRYTLPEDGKLTDTTIQETISRLRDDVPEVDEPAVEAYLALSRAYAVHFASLASQYEDLGLSVPRLNTLRWLYHAEGGHLTISELSALLEATLPTVMRMVGVLEDEGWIQRSQSESDRRVTLVGLTSEGRRRFRPVLQRAVGIWSEIWSALDEEEKSTLAQLLSKFRVNLLSRFIGHDRLMPYKLDKIAAQKDRSGYSPRTPG